MGHAFSLLHTLLQLAVCIVLIIKFPGLPRIFSGLAGGLWLISGIVYAFAFRVVFWSPYFSLVGLAGWVCFLVAVSTLSARGIAGTTTVATGTEATMSTGVGFTGPLSKPFYLTSIIASFATSTIFALLAFAAMASGSHSDEEAGIVFAVLMFLPLIYGTVVMAVFIHNMWSAIQDGSPRATPGRAVGFLFIPLFNYYWVFQALWGWTRDFNAYTTTKGLRAPRMPEGLAQAICILAVVSVIPIVGIACSLVNAVLMSMFISQACDGVNAIAPANRPVLATV
jgi:hypothetical protein